MTTEFKQLSEQVNQTAADWFARMQSGQVSAQQEQKFKQWLAEDARHAESYRQLEEIWQGLADMRSSPEADSLKRSVEMQSHSAVSGFFASLVGWIDEQRLLAAGVVSASLLLVLLSTVFVSTPVTRDTVQQRYVSGTAEIRSVLLADESRAELGAESEIRLRMTDSERHVELVRGEAFFDVVADADRPFYVKVDEVRVRVVGTQFDVRKRFGGVSVSVMDGIVQVDGNSGGNQQGHAPAVKLTAGQKVVKQKSRSFGAVETVSELELGAWRQGRLIYQDADLIDVVSDANRYFDGHISLQTSALFHEKITLTVRTDQIGLLPDRLSQALSLTVHELPDNRIVLAADSELDQP